MHRYRVIAKLTCSKCHLSQRADDGDVRAESEKQAQEKFLKKYRLCPNCLARGLRATVKLEGFIYIDSLSGPRD